MYPGETQGVGNQKSPFVTYAHDEVTNVLNDVEKKQKGLNQIRRQMGLVKASAAEHHRLGEEAGKKAAEYRQKAQEAQTKMDASAARIQALKNEQERKTQEADTKLRNIVAMLALGTTNENFIETRAPKEGIEFNSEEEGAFIRKSAMLRIIQLSKQFTKNLSPGDFRRCKAPGSIEGLDEFIAAIPLMSVEKINIPCPIDDKQIVALAKARLAKNFELILGDPETQRKFALASAVK